MLSFLSARYCICLKDRLWAYLKIQVASNVQNVGFIGVGNMGFHMAKNLISAGYKLTVHDT